MGKIYLGRSSYYGIEVGKVNKGEKALINALAQFVDFLDGDTVKKNGGRFVKARFVLEKRTGSPRSVSFVGRMRIIYRYAPKRVYPYLKKIEHIATLYAHGRLSKKKAIEKVIGLVSRAGLSRSLAKRVVNTVLRKDR